MTSAAKKNFITDCDALQEAGKGVRFNVRDAQGEHLPAFAICFEGGYFAYLNRCGHIAVQLDFQPGVFFADDGHALVCATHGAEYAPDTGACLGGPCFGVGLQALPTRIEKGKMFLNSKEFDVI